MVTRRSLFLFFGGLALLVLAAVLRFVGTNEPLRAELHDAAMSAAGLIAGRAPMPPTAELLLLDESGLVLRGPAALQGTRLQLDAVRQAQIDGNGVGIERWPDGESWLTAFAATRRSTANTLRIAVVRHPPDRGGMLRASPWVAAAGGVLLLFAGVARRRREDAVLAASATPTDPAPHGVTAPSATVLKFESRSVRAPLTTSLAFDEEPPLLLEQVVDEAPMHDAVTAAIARMPMESMPIDPLPTDEHGKIRLIELDAATPLFNDAPLLALQMSVPTESFERVLQARLADAARRVRILQVAADAYDAGTLQREASDLAEFAAAFGAPALREAVALVSQVAELQLAPIYASAVRQVADLFEPTQEAITARFIARADRA